MCIRIHIALFCLPFVALWFVPPPANAFLEDLCQSRRPRLEKEKFGACIRPVCPAAFPPDRACPAQLLDFATIKPGRSMIHADSTYFIAQALGYRADVAYWIAAYNEVADYGHYNPIDQCGNEAARDNSGREFMAAAFNGFRRTNINTDGPFDHYVVSFSQNGQGTDVHGAGGVQALYPLHYPKPGYPERIDDTYQKTLANARQWAMLPTRAPGLLCTVGLTSPDGTCLRGTIASTVPLIVASSKGLPLNVAAGRKILNYDKKKESQPADVDYYEKLEAYLDDKRKTTGTLWKDPADPKPPVPVQVARIGLYLHMLQDSSSHATYCGDDAPSPLSGGDSGTYMYMADAKKNEVKVVFGSPCASSPHLAGHVQETGTGKDPLPLRDYVALNNTVDELIVFGNEVAKLAGWIVNPELLPGDVGDRRAADLKAELVGRITSGTAYSRAEVYTSGIVTQPLQLKEAHARLSAMNKALGEYAKTLHERSADRNSFTALEPMPGNSFFDPKSTMVCWKG